MIEQIEQQHGRSDAGPLVDLLQWSLDADPTHRPATIDAILDHAFFNPEKGSLREDFAMNRLRGLIANPTYDRRGCNVMISYSWTDTNFVLGKLAPELAISCKSLWLDRLGGNQGMGEWAVESMQRGVQGADVVVAVVSPSYIQSVNCGKEMDMAARSHTPVLPIVLGVPFSEWPPRRVGGVQMQEQFASSNGDIKIFVDMTDGAQFHTKFNRELLPRLSATWGGQVGKRAHSTVQAAAGSDDAAATDVAMAAGAEIKGGAKPARPGRRQRAQVGPASEDLPQVRGGLSS